MGVIVLGSADAETLDTITATLEALGHTVHSTGLSHELIDLAESLSPMLIVLDEALPSQPTDEILSMLVTDHENRCPILFVTKHPNDPPEGVDAVFPKHTHSGILVEVLTSSFGDAVFAEGWD